MEMEITFPGGARVDAAFKNFVVKTDQPVYVGGDNSAPTPFALFLASLGTCAGIFVLNFCRQRDIPTENIHLHQSIVVDPETRMVTQVNVDIFLPPDFPARYRRAVIRTAELCSVKKLMDHPPEFNVEAYIGE